MHNLLKRQYSNKQGSGCQMCKPQKHHHADRRTVHDVRADMATFEQLAELEDDLRASRSLATAESS